MTPKQTQQQKIEVELKKIRTCILAFRADMQVQMTDNTEGEIFSAVPTKIVNQWFDILEKKVAEALEAQRQQHLKILKKSTSSGDLLGAYPEELKMIKRFTTLLDQSEKEAEGECKFDIGNNSCKGQMNHICSFHLNDLLEGGDK